MGRNSSYLAGFSIFSHGSMKKFNKLAKKKKKILKIFPSGIKTKVAIKFPRKLFFFSDKNRIGTERVKGVYNGKINIFFKELTPRSRTYELRGQGEKRKKKITKSQPTNTSHCPTKTISKKRTTPP